MRTLTANRTWLAGLGVGVALAGVAWWGWTPVQTWHQVRQLAAARPENREGAVSRVVELDEAAVPSLLARLRDADPTVCNNVQAALVALRKRWGPGDERGA